MYTNHREIFNAYILGTKPLQEFWANVPEDDPRLEGHPLLKIDNYRARAIALRLHGDGVPVGKAKGRSLDVLSINSLHGQGGSTWITKLLIFAIMSTIKVGGSDGNDGTMDVAWKVILWSFKALLRGKWPRTDWNGKPVTGLYAEKAGEDLCGGYVFVLFQLVADLDYLCNYLGLPHFNNKLNPCMKCKCNRTNIPVLDLRPTAGWRSRMVSQVDWFLAQKHILFRDTAVGLTLWHILLDVMHCLDLGVVLQVAASVLYMLVFDGPFPGNVDAKIQAVWDEMTLAYNGLGTPAGERLDHATLLDIFDGSRSWHPTRYPVLHSKAAVARHSILALNVLLQKNTDGMDGFVHVRELVGNLSSFYDVMAYYDMWLSNDAAQEMHDYLLEAGVHHQYLCHVNKEQGRKLFHMTEKSHYVQHIALDILSTRFNPRFAWVYADEDYMGRIAQL